MNSFFETITEDDITYYIIPRETLLYHGSNRLETVDNFTANTHTFFALTPEYAQTYAKESVRIFVYQPKEDIKLVAMDLSNQTLYNNAPKHIKLIMTNQYGLNTEHKRRSDPIEDNTLSEYLCQTSYTGYAANKMKGITEFDDLDAEIVICNINKLQFVKLIQANVNKVAQSIGRKKKPSSDIITPVKQPRNGLFDSPSSPNLPRIGLFETPPKTGSLFGDDEPAFNG